MIKLIFHNIWNRRRQYAWLFIELIIVTAIAWYIFDPAIVSVYDTRLPLGYDADRLAIVDIKTLEKENKNYSPADTSAEAMTANFERVLERIRTYSGVERFTIALNSYFNRTSISMTRRQNSEKNHPTMYFMPGYDFFETFGIQSMPGSPTAEELSARTYNNEIIITRTLAETFWPGENACGKYFTTIRPGDPDTVFTYVAGVVEDLRYQAHLRTGAMELLPDTNARIPFSNFSIIVRLADGVNPGKWCEDFRTWAVKNLRIGNYYCRDVTEYRNMIEQTEHDVTTERRMAWLLAAFFLVNLILGVIGSFYLQTRRRIAEMGIHRSFGARKHDILAIIMGESLVLALIATIIGDLIYLQYAIKSGLAIGHTNNNAILTMDSWVTNFNEHFVIVSAIVCVIILICVAIGTWLPARNISRINPVDALRDE